MILGFKYAIGENGLGGYSIDALGIFPQRGKTGMSQFPIMVKAHFGFKERIHYNGISLQILLYTLIEKSEVKRNDVLFNKSEICFWTI